MVLGFEDFSAHAHLAASARAHTHAHDVCPLGEKRESTPRLAIRHRAYTSTGVKPQSVLAHGAVALKCEGTGA